MLILRPNCALPDVEVLVFQDQRKSYGCCKNRSLLVRAGVFSAQLKLSIRCSQSWLKRSFTRCRWVQPGGDVIHLKCSGPDHAPQRTHARTIQHPCTSNRSKRWFDDYSCRNWLSSDQILELVYSASQSMGWHINNRLYPLVTSKRLCKHHGKTHRIRYQCCDAGPSNSQRSERQREQR